MKNKIFNIKNIKINMYIHKVHNGFEFIPIGIYKLETSYHTYFTIKVSLIKLLFIIDFVWNGRK